MYVRLHFASRIYAHLYWVLLKQHSSRTAPPSTDEMTANNNRRCGPLGFDPERRDDTLHDIMSKADLMYGNFTHFPSSPLPCCTTWRGVLISYHSTPRLLLHNSAAGTAPPYSTLKHCRHLASPVVIIQDTKQHGPFTRLPCACG